MLSAVFTSRLGMGSVLAMLLGALWRAVALWETIDFLGAGGHMATLGTLFESVWGPILLVLVGLFGLYRVVSARLPDVQSAVNRKAAKDVLGQALREGQSLAKGKGYAFEDEHYYVVDLEKLELDSRYQEKFDREVREWVHKTHDFIEAAFDKGKAHRFLDSGDYKPKGALPFKQTRLEPYKYHLTPRLQRLNELNARADELEVNPDFDTQYWMGRFNLE
jgi:hypothetical protein